jgi:hypothetical protein
MQFTPRKSIGGRAWLSISLETAEREKALVLWANTSLGLLLTGGTQTSSNRVVEALDGHPKVPSREPNRVAAPPLNSEKRFLANTSERVCEVLANNLLSGRVA